MMLYARLPPPGHQFWMSIDVWEMSIDAKTKCLITIILPQSDVDFFLESSSFLGNGVDIWESI